MAENLHTKPLQYTDITQEDLQNLLEMSHEIMGNLALKNLMQTSIEKIVTKCNLLGGILFQLKEDKIYARTIAGEKGVQNFLKLIREPISNLKLNMNTEIDNYVVNCIIKQQDQFSYDLYDFTRGVLSQRVTKVAKLLTSTQSCIAFPILYRGKAVGALFFSKAKKEDFSKEMHILKFAADLLGIAMTNANLYTDLENSNKELQQALDTVNELRRQEKDMIDVMGHELKTPITAVQAILEVMDKTYQQKGTIDNDKLGKYLKLAVESTKKEVALIRTLLSATRVEYNRFEINYEPLNLLDVLELSINSHKELIDKQKLKIRYRRPYGEFIINTDKSRLYEIIDNLISNAIKYTPRGFIEVTVTENIHEASFSIRDTGIGISKSDLKDLGKKFFRVKPSQYRKGFIRPGGTGLGLYVVFNLVTMIGAKIDVKSEPGRGTKFTITLPKQSPSPEGNIVKSKTP